MTIIIATIGKKIANELKVIAVPVSAVETTGFPKPAVFTDEASLVMVVIPCMAVAVPPPAIIANPQVSIGSKCTNVDAIAAVPAIAANGVAIVSKRLSTNGI